MYVSYLKYVDTCLLFIIYALLVLINGLLLRITFRVFRQKWSTFVEDRRTTRFRRKLAICIARSFVGCEVLDVKTVDRTKFFYNTKNNEIEYIYKQSKCKVYQFLVK